MSTIPPGHKQAPRWRVQTLHDQPIGTDVKGLHQAYLATKTSKSGAKSTYIEIYPGDDPSFVCDYAAIASDFNRLFSKDVFPKGRVITKEDPVTHQRESIGYISRQIPGYQPINQIPPAHLRTMIPLLSGRQKKQLAELFVGTYVSGENDLHNGNWGIGSDGGIIKIDNDQAFFGHTARYKRLDQPQDIPLQLIKWPNTIHESDHSFPISISDIEKLPMINYASPSNWPSLNQGEATRDLCQQLANDSTFKQYKWQAFTKLLLTQDSQIKDIINSNSTMQPDAEKLNTYLINRKQQLQENLLACPEYRQYLIDLTTNDITSITNEIKEYNSDYCKKSTDGSRTTDIKAKHQHRVYNIETVNNELVKLIDLAINPTSNPKIQYLQLKLNDAELYLQREIFAHSDIENNRFHDYDETSQWVDDKLFDFKNSGLTQSQALQKLCIDIEKYFQVKIPLHDCIMAGAPVDIIHLKTQVHNDVHAPFLKDLENEYNNNIASYYEYHHALTNKLLTAKIANSKPGPEKEELQRQLGLLPNPYDYAQYAHQLNAKMLAEPKLRTPDTAPIAEARSGIIAARSRRTTMPVEIPTLVTTVAASRLPITIQPELAAGKSQLTSPQEDSPPVVQGAAFADESQEIRPQEAQSENLLEGESSRPKNSPKSGLPKVLGFLFSMRKTSGESEPNPPEETKDPDSPPKSRP